MKNFTFLCYWDLMEKRLKELCLLGDKNNVLMVDLKKKSQNRDLNVNRLNIKIFLTQDRHDLSNIDDTFGFKKLNKFAINLTHFGIKFKWLNR